MRSNIKVNWRKWLLVGVGILGFILLLVAPTWFLLVRYMPSQVPDQVYEKVVGLRYNSVFGQMYIWLLFKPASRLFPDQLTSLADPINIYPRPYLVGEDAPGLTIVEGRVAEIGGSKLTGYQRINLLTDANERLELYYNELDSSYLIPSSYDRKIMKLCYRSEAVDAGIGQVLVKGQRVRVIYYDGKNKIINELIGLLRVSENES